MPLGKGQYKVKVKIEGERKAPSTSSQLNTPTISQFNCNGSKRYTEYEVVAVNGIMPNTFVTLGKG